MPVQMGEKEPHVGVGSLRIDPGVFWGIVEGVSACLIAAFGLTTSGVMHPTSHTLARIFRAPSNGVVERAKSPNAAQVVYHTPLLR